MGKGCLNSIIGTIAVIIIAIAFLVTIWDAFSPGFKTIIIIVIVFFVLKALVKNKH